MRRLMQLPESQKITKKFLRESMTMEQYNTARSHYGEALRQILEEDVPNHEPPATREPVSPEPAPATETPEPAEGSAAVPSSASLSAPEADATELDRQRLRQEVASWQLRVKPEEIEPVIQHNPYSKARRLLWAARRQPEPALAS
jgi:hypothetical protein